MAITDVPDLVRRKNSIIFTGEVLDIYVPKANFDSKLSEYSGEYIKTMGIFLFQIRTLDQANNNRETKIYSMKMPIDIEFQYTSSFKYKGKLGDYPSDEYEVFRLENGNAFIANVMMEKKSSYVIDFIGALHNGKLPKMLSYDEVIQLYHKVLEISGVGLNAPSIIYELTIAEVYRSKSNIKRPFREQANKSSDPSRYNYTSMRINDLAMLNSTFAGLTFEHMNDAVLTSIERTQSGEDEQYSPLEKISRY